MDPERRALSSRSPATRYEVLLVEDYSKKGLCEEQMATCFHVFDEVIQCVGVYKIVLKMLRDKLYDAVYSNEYTTVPPKKTMSKTSYIQRIPYFVLVNRIFEERDKTADELRANITALENNLNEKGKQLDECNQSNRELRKSLKESSDKIYEMEIELENKSLEQRKLEASIQYEQLTQQATKDRYERRISGLKNELTQAKDRNNFLEKFKEGYDSLEAAFNDSVTIDKNPQKPVVLTRKAQIIQEIASAKLLEEQLLTMQNTVIEEFDSYLEETKATPNSNVDLKSNGSRSNLRVTPDDEYEARVKQEENLHKIKMRFKKSIDDVKNEFQLIEIQKSSLEDQLAQLEEEANAVEKEAAKKTDRKKSLFHIDRERDNKPAEPEDDGEMDFVKIMNSAHHQDPFIPHEKILSKYAAMIYYSCNQGKNYHEFKDARYCPSCGETTLFCPHKVTDHKVLSLPHNCTHVKIVRPTVHIVQEGSQFTDPMPKTPESVHPLSVRPSSTLSFEEASILQAQQHLTTSYKFLWDDYYSRTSSRRQIPRLLSEDRVLSIIEQFYSFLIWQDDYAVEDEQIVSVTETMYSFFHERYLVPEVTYLAVYDFIASVVKFAPDNNTIQLFAQSMCGSIDPVVIRYILLVNDFIDMIEWVAVKDIRTFAKILYPFMNEEDIEQFSMGYTSFSENKISKDLVSQYFLYIMLKYREPRFQEIEIKLLQQPGRRPGFMTDIEYAEAVDNICPLASERLRRRLFVESAAHMGSTDDSVSVMRLAQITGYLILLQLMPVIKDSVAQKIEAARPVVKGDLKDSPEIINNATETFSYQTTTTARAIAAENAKRSRTRQLQRIEEYQCE